MEEEQPNQPPLADPKDKLVLIVDDDESILDLMEHVVKKEGFRVERAGDGPEAVQKAHGSNPDLIVLDFMLPGIGGFEVLRQLQMSETVRIPVLVITGRHMDRQGVEVIRHEPNVCEFMEKPIRPAILTALLHRILKTSPPDIRRSTDRGPLSGSW